ncbi:putative multidrug resistance protein [Escherichia coli]|nr:putative multidrug resistance protein [Escherichia coli]
MLPASGWLADKVGVRNIFFTAIVLFTLGSLFCALSGTLNELLLARAFTGRWRRDDGAGRQIDGDENRTARAIYGGDDLCHVTGQVGPLLGPALGGLLVEYASWHWIFLINIPVGIIGAIATLLVNAKLHHADAAL